MVKEPVKRKMEEDPKQIKKRSCGTMDEHYRLMHEDESYAKARARIENNVFEFARLFRASARGVARIPIVVHVVWNSEEQNISDAQIQSQIDVINKDFRRLNPDTSKVPSVWQSLMADARIEFFLATKDPKGKQTNGITRTKTNAKIFHQYTNDIKSISTGGEDAWPRDRYLNLWVGPVILSAIGEELLGYASFPGMPAEIDGVVIAHTAFGTTGTAQPPYNMGRTATHEIGHWLDLYHIWGDDDTGCSGTDKVDDTPNQGGPNTGTPSFPHISCDNGPNGDMFMNYMDYVEDSSMFMFTEGQVTRIDACLEGFRKSIIIEEEPGETGRIKGIVESKSSGNPLEHARVFIDIISDMTNSDGTYELSGVPAGDREITATKAGYKDAKTKVLVEKDEEITANTIELEEINKSNIKGKIVYKSTKKPVEGAKVSIDTGQSVMTKADGTYEMTGVTAGGRVIIAAKPRYKCVCTSIDVKEGDEEVIANFELIAGQ